MPSLEISSAQIIDLIKQLPVRDQLAIFSILSEELAQQLPAGDLETQDWLADELAPELPPYEWEGEIPESQPVRYIPGTGLVIGGE